MVRQVCHDVAVMYLGRIVEHGPAAAVLARPVHPYAEALVSAIPVAGPTRGRGRIILAGDPPSPLALPVGCSFHGRCAHATARCRAEAPALRAMPDGRRVACHVADARGPWAA